MIKKVATAALARLEGALGPEGIARVWESIVHALSGDWGFVPGAVSMSYDQAKNCGLVQIGVYHIAKVACEGLRSDYWDLYVQIGRQKWGYEVYEGAGHLYKLDVEAF